MFDNLLFQPVGIQLTEDIKKGILPKAMLFVGPSNSGKLTCALELSRILSCTNIPKGEWTCTCSACLKHKALVNTSLLVTGPKSCTLEIASSAKTLLEAASSNATYINAARYLFIRSIRKLTLRFSPILWEGDDKVAKISPLLVGIEEYLEELDPLRPLPELDKLEKICSSVQPLCAKLEADFMYDSIPVAQIRRISNWAHFKAESGKKVVVIENAQRMQDSVRNALLKILEEPPEDVFFILTARRKIGVMPTILSRVRTYNFVERTLPQQSEIIKRVFHSDVQDNFNTSLDLYLQSFLPIKPAAVADSAEKFVRKIILGQIPDLDEILKSCNGFEPRLLLNIFLNEINQLLFSVVTQRQDNNSTTKDVLIVCECNKCIQNCWTNITIYNQSVVAALENLLGDLEFVFTKYGGISIL